MSWRRKRRNGPGFCHGLASRWWARSSASWPD